VNLKFNFVTYCGTVYSRVIVINFGENNSKSENLCSSSISDFTNSFFLISCLAGNDIASTLATHMRKRSRDVFGNGLYLAALSLDPRYVLDLSEEQLNIGIEFLLKVNEKILCLKRLNDNRERAAVLQDQNANGSTSTALTEAERLFEQELLKKRENRGMNTHDPLSSVLITDFAMHPPPLPLNASILEFWDSDTIKLQYPQLHTLAKVIMSVPATQVSVERTFSQLKYVLNDLRMRLKSENISDILLIRCNEKNLPTKCVYRLD